MAPVTKSTPLKRPKDSQQGQISIFFSASLVVLISIIAFVINVGLFVKAKINLQNATDAAAFSGAAVQARQLTKIAYLNWEMRNIYKEWMYKYYIVGNLNIDDVRNASPTNSGKTSFRMLKDRDAITGAEFEDPYNLPAVCIHLQGSNTNICRRYGVPGLPEFGPSNLPGAEEASRAFMDSLIRTKTIDCKNRTRLNMLVAAMWAYNVLSNNSMDATLAGEAPAVLADRQGAWPQALELAMRIRNLEFAMNRTAVTERVCISPGASSKIPCNTTIDSLMGEKKLGNERIVKAFYAGYRNVGGSHQSDEMKNSFTLTEIPPKKIPKTSSKSASYLLVPEEKNDYEKQYVDLRLMVVNYAVLYDAMIATATPGRSGACDISKAAIPVPGYPLGYYKDPDVLTYYAVRGEAVFEGMFNPFNDEIKLTTYAAAKPFGGRIGPMLFYQDKGSDAFTGRKDAAKRRSVPYLTSLDVVGTPTRPESHPLKGAKLQLGDYVAGAPLPVNFPDAMFWLEKEDRPVGGLLPSGDVQFGIPNLVYDYENGYTSDGYTTAGELVYKIQPGFPGNEQAVGLYSKKQLGMFKGTRLTTSVTPQQLDEEIARIRAATKYEAANYLVPTPHDLNKELSVDSFGFIGAPPEALENGVKRYRSFIYAPLYGSVGNDQSDILYSDRSKVLKVIAEFMRAQENGIDKYRIAMNRAAKVVHDTPPPPSAPNSRPAYQDAGRKISDINFSATIRDERPKSCDSIAGTFLYYFYAAPINPGYLGPGFSSAGCPTSIGALLDRYFTPGGGAGPNVATHYEFAYSWNRNNFTDSLQTFSAYVPGRYTGVSLDGVFTNPLPGASPAPEAMRRNFYSTKLIALKSLKIDGKYAENSTRFVIHSEGTLSIAGANEPGQTTFANPLDPDQIGEDISSIEH